MIKEGRYHVHTHVVVVEEDIYSPEINFEVVCLQLDLLPVCAKSFTGHRKFLSNWQLAQITLDTLRLHLRQDVSANKSAGRDTFMCYITAGVMQCLIVLHVFHLFIYLFGFEHLTAVCICYARLGVMVKPFN